IEHFVFNRRSALRASRLTEDFVLNRSKNKFLHLIEHFVLKRHSVRCASWLIRNSAFHAEYRGAERSQVYELFNLDLSLKIRQPSLLLMER
ncbi:MAG: hypothetical protein KAU14_07890, partial [Thermoplasmata archaeon]|nr:hypothetical protein [Thermoplasmata archaeon]